MTHGRGGEQGSSMLGLLGWIAITAAAGALGSAASAGARDFYATLQRPAWAPSGALFGPVWTALYLMMAVAAWMVWKARNFVGARIALLLFAVQLVLNALWSWLFFAWHQGALAFLELLILWLAVALTTNLFWRVRPAAGMLMLPYLAWVTFAGALTFAIWRGNPGVL